MLIVLVVSVLMVILGLSLTVTSMTDFSISHSLQSKKMAMLTANAGLAAARDQMKGASLDTLLAATTVVPKYINYSEPNSGTDAETYFNRNPIAPMEAMNVDFHNPPTQISTRSVAGLLTSASGETLPDGGRYWAKLTDNDDGDSDLSTDQDGTVYLRVLAVRSLGAGQISTFGGTVKNTVAILEATIGMDSTFYLEAALTVLGPDIDIDLEAEDEDNFFIVDGFDHSGMDLTDLINDVDSHTTGGDAAGIQTIYDNPTTDGQTARNAIHTEIDSEQYDNITGDTWDYGATPSIRDGTQTIRDNTDPDSEDIFDVSYVLNFRNNLKAIADVVVTNQKLWASNLGTDANPLITYCDTSGNQKCKLQENANGAGLLIVEGRLDFTGKEFNYHGLVMVIGGMGELILDDDESDVNILGGLMVSAINSNTFVNADISTGDETQVKLLYSKDAIEAALSLLPPKKLGWREIVPDLEPSF